MAIIYTNEQLRQIVAAGGGLVINASTMTFNQVKEIVAAAGGGKGIAGYAWGCHACAGILYLLFTCFQGRPLMFRWILLLTFCAATGSAFAQASGSLTGKWHAKYPSPSGVPREANVSIEGDSGTWQVTSFDKFDKCIGLKVPLSISKATRNGFTLSLAGSKVLKGCPDSVWRLKRVDDKTFDSTFRDGRTLVMKRQ